MNKNQMKNKKRTHQLLSLLLFIGISFLVTVPNVVHAVPLDVQQEIRKQISGTIKDRQGNPIIGAYVLVKGQTGGTTSDEDGKYAINVTGDVTLVYSYIGFHPIERSTKGESVINIVLVEDDQDLNEVVITGYNTVERKHLASSIEAVDIDKVQRRPVFKLQEAFAGSVSGVVLNQGSNAPGDAGSISIRGVGTLKGSTPLVVIDGMEQSMSDIDLNQIKSITVLKDASAASMYGSRGANGVIIIETLRGNTGEFKVSLHSWAAIQSQTDKPDFVGAADYMTLNNEAKRLQNQTLLYTQDQIDAASRGEGANVDWWDAIMQRKASAYNFNANISGGGGVGTFNLMLGYLTENGLNKKDGTDKFSARFNTNINIDERFIIMADFYAHRLAVNRLMANDGSTNYLYNQAYKMNPTQEIFYPDSDFGIAKHYMLHNGNINPVATMNESGQRNNLHDRITLNIRPRYYILPEFHIAADLSYMMNKSSSKWERQTFRFYDGNGAPVDMWGHSVGSSQGVSESQITGRFQANYEKDLRDKKDKLYIVGGSEIMDYTFTDFRQISKASFFGKVNYSFDDRYLLEATVRSDGSSKFAPGHQWGVFPSMSVGWNAHNEAFFKNNINQDIISNLKFRFSYGKIGNEDVDPYLWQEKVNTWGWTMRIPNPDFTWEKQKQWNVGLDFAALRNRLNITADIYGKQSYDLIYASFPAPPLTGAHVLETAMNIGEVDNNGWEVSLKWTDKIGENFRYQLGAMLFDNKNEVKKAGYTADDVLVFKDNADKIWYRGVPVDNYYGYTTDGYFQSQEEINNTKAKMPNTRVGDVKYIDRNDDGIINDDDKVILGSPLPRYNYAVSIDLGYKDWDFSVLGTGVGKRDGRLGGLEGMPVIVDGSTNALGTPREYYMKNRWTPENPNSRFPRVWTGASTNQYLSDVWISDASYFRIKSLQLGYTFKKVTEGISNLRLYFNAQDFLTVTNWEGLEPERYNGGNGVYPKMATFSVGVQVTFF